MSPTRMHGLSGGKYWHCVAEEGIQEAAVRSQREWPGGLTQWDEFRAGLEKGRWEQLKLQREVQARSGPGEKAPNSSRVRTGRKGL